MLSGWDVQFRGHENFGVAILENFFPQKAMAVNSLGAVIIEKLILQPIDLDHLFSINDGFLFLKDRFHFK